MLDARAPVINQKTSRDSPGKSQSDRDTGHKTVIKNKITVLMEE